MRELTLGSLFDGSGGFPLAAALEGIRPVWASEVEPYPIAVTRSRFPGMKHYGDVSRINGADIDPVDIITFGSPCQDLSVAGLRQGLRHEGKGDKETTRSGLFLEAIRIIKEMREATHGVYPAYAIWENVTGAFSSGKGAKGEDFRTVLNEFVNIVEPGAEVPPPPQGKWPYADILVGDGWSVAYRTFDAQYWGVPQRRRRVYLVASFGNERAGEILFKRAGLRGHNAPRREAGERTAAETQNDVGTADAESVRGIITINKGDPQSKRVYDPAGIAPALAASASSWMGPELYVLTNEVYSVENHPNDSRVKIVENGTVQALTQRMDTGGNNTPLVLYGISAPEKTGVPMASGYAKNETQEALNDMYVVQAFAQNQRNEVRNLGTKAGSLAANPGMNQQTYVLQGSMIGRKDENGPQGNGISEDVAFTLNTIDHHAVAYGVDFRTRVDAPVTYNGETVTSPTNAQNPRPGDPCHTLGTDGRNYLVEHLVEQKYIVRRLTPTECCRLQGFFDGWGEIDHKEDLSDEEFEFWLDVRNTHGQINGKAIRHYTKAQMLTWYNKLHTDSAEYKMWGNGIALPCALYVMQGIVEAVKEDEENV